MQIKIDDVFLAVEPDFSIVSEKAFVRVDLRCNQIGPSFQWIRGTILEEIMCPGLGLLFFSLS